MRQHAPKTLIVLTSDNGAATQHRFEHAGSNGPLRCGKGTAFEGGVRTMGVFWMPGVIEAGTMAMQPLSTLDLFPTLLSMAGMGSGSSGSDDGVVLDGRDISSLLRSISSSSDEPPLPESPLVWYAGDKVLAVRTGVWKVHFGLQGWGKSWERGVARNAT